MANILDRFGITGSIKLKLISLFLLVSIIPIIAVSNLAFEYGSASTEEQVMTNLASVADFKVSEIGFWLENQINNAQVLSNSIKFVNFLVGHKENAENLPELENDAMNLFKTINDTHNHKRLSLIDSSGEVLLSTDSEDVGSIIDDRYATTPFITGEIYIQDIFKTAEDDLSMIFAAPIFSIDTETYEQGNEVIGVLIIEIDMATSLYPMIQDLHHMDETSETLLVRREGNEVVFISELRKLNESPLYLRVPITSTTALLAIRSSKGEEGIMITEDYMGEEVLSAYRHIEILNWGIISKIDKNEAFAGIDLLKYKITAVSLFLILISFGMAIWISTGITRPIIYLEEITKKVAQGDYSDHPVIDSNDEIGSLSNSFTKMEQDLSISRRKLEDYNKDLEEKVEERTQELEQRTQDLLASKQKLIRAQEIGHIGDWENDIETDRITWSDELFRIYGFEPTDELNLETVVARMHPDDRDYVNETLAGWIENGEGEPFEYRVVRPDGSIRHVYSPADVIRDSTGKVVKLYGVTLDITERKQSEEALQGYTTKLELNKKRLDVLLQLTHMTDSSLEDISDFVLNKGAELTNSEFGFIGLMNEDETVLTNRSRTKNVMDDCDVIDKPLQYPVDGAGLWSESLIQRKSVIINDYESTEFNKNGVPKGHIPLRRLINVPIFEDDRIVAIAMMANKEEEYDEDDVLQLTLLLEGMWKIVMRKHAEMEKDMLIHEISERTKDLNLLYNISKLGAQTGISWENVIEQAIVFIPAGWQYPEITCSRIILNGKEYATPNFAKTMWGQIEPIIIFDEVVGSVEVYYLEEMPKIDEGPFFEEERDLINSVAKHLASIIERKKAEESLKEYAKDLKRSNELKVLFADIMHHDLLNPAGIVQSYTEILYDMEDDEKKIGLLQKIETNNKKLINLIETTARFAKLESVEELEFGEENIADMFKIVVSNLKPQIEDKQITLEFKAEGTYMANVNPVIEEVFVNLLSNSIKYSPEKSKIIVDIIDAGEDWKIAVSDLGEGVLDKDKPLLFDRFERVNKIAVKGSGLGLAIVKRIIELHGGDFGVEDNPDGVGSVFWVTVKKA